MRILFINPVTPPEIFKVQLSLGVAYLSSILKKDRHQISLLCPFKFDTDEISRKVLDFKPELIMVSTVSDQFELSKRIIEYTNYEYGIPVIIGGAHAIVAPQECIGVGGVIGVCIGEGEVALAEFVKIYSEKKDYTKVRNFWFKKGNKIIKNQLRPLIKDLDSLPFPDREIFEEYVDTKDEIEFMAARGCPYQCSYCINKAMQETYKGNGQYVRYRSVDNLLDEIGQVLGKYKTAKLLFHDDTFTLNKPWLREFSEKYPKGIRKQYIANGRVETLDEETVKLLKKSGCVELKIGVESGNEKIRREVLKRNMTDSQIINAFRLCKKYGILATSFSMIGVPGETEKEIMDTIRLNRKIKPFRMGVSIFKPYPGTSLYDACKNNGWISNRKVISYFEDVSILNLPTISHKKIEYYHKIFKLSVYHSIIVQFVKVLIFVKIYDPLIRLICSIKRFIVKFLTREQKDAIMKVLKI